MKIIWNLLRVLTTPSCWFQLNCYSVVWDAELNRLMATESFQKIGRHWAVIGGRKVWILNHPYASFSFEEYNIRPKRSTVLRAMDKLHADMLKQALNQDGAQDKEMK